VSSSQPARRRSVNVSTRSSRVSPKPTITPDFTTPRPSRRATPAASARTFLFSYVACICDMDGLASRRTCLCASSLCLRPVVRQRMLAWRSDSPAGRTRLTVAERDAELCPGVATARPFLTRLFLYEWGTRRPGSPAVSTSSALRYASHGRVLLAHSDRLRAIPVRAALPATCRACRDARRVLCLRHAHHRRREVPYWLSGSRCTPCARWPHEHRYSRLGDARTATRCTRRPSEARSTRSD